MTRPLLVVLRALGLGDYLTGVPALRALARAFPGHRRVLLAPGALAPLDHHVGANHELRPHSGLSPLPADLAGASLAVDLHGRGPGSQPLLLALRPRRLISFAHDAVPGTELGSTWRPEEHEVLRWCRLLEEHGIASDPYDLRINEPSWPVAEARISATILHPGASSPARRWPLDRFVAVGLAEGAAGRTVVVTGGPGEETLVAELADRLDLAPVQRVLRVGLLELAAIVGRADRLVCGDTGIAHLANALGTPSVILHGPVGPHLWGALPGLGPNHVSLWAGRCGDPHANAPDPGLLEITVEDVLSALRHLEAVARARVPEWSRARPAPAGVGVPRSTQGA